MFLHKLNVFIPITKRWGHIRFVKMSATIGGKVQRRSNLIIYMRAHLFVRPSVLTFVLLAVYPLICPVIRLLVVPTTLSICPSALSVVDNLLFTKNNDISLKFSRIIKSSQFAVGSGSNDLKHFTAG